LALERESERRERLVEEPERKEQKYLRVAAYQCEVGETRNTRKAADGSGRFTWADPLQGV